MASSAYDVVIVGAGLAGLQAAISLQSEGLHYIVLEARDRVGGRTLTSRSSSGGTKAELGAAWINDTNQSRMWALAQDLRLHTFEQNTKGDVVVQDFAGQLVKFPYGEAPKVSIPFLLLVYSGRILTRWNSMRLSKTQSHACRSEIWLRTCQQHNHHQSSQRDLTERNSIRFLSKHSSASPRLQTKRLRLLRFGPTQCWASILPKSQPYISSNVSVFAA